MDEEEHTNKENNVAKDMDCCFLLQNPNNSNKNNKSWY